LHWLASQRELWFACLWSPAPLNATSPIVASRVGSFAINLNIADCSQNLFIAEGRETFRDLRLLLQNR
jgi:hypothetical protein